MAKLNSEFRNPSDSRSTPYTYYCTICDEEEDLYYGMHDKRPSTYDCPVCEAENSMQRIFGTSTIQIPFDWSEDKGKKIKFDKRPSGQRKLHPVGKNIK